MPADIAPADHRSSLLWTPAGELPHSHRDATSFFDLIMRGRSLGCVGEFPVSSTCEGAGFRFSAETARSRADGEYVQLDDGVWLAAGRARFFEAGYIWTRMRDALAFGVLLNGSAATAELDHLDEPWASTGGTVTAVAHEDGLCGVATVPGTSWECVTLLFRDETALRQLGFDRSDIAAWLPETAPQSIPKARASFGIASQRALATAWDIRHAPYEGRLRRSLLKAKAVEFLCHALASRVEARTPAESQALAARSDAGLATIAHLALANPEYAPTPSGFARRIGVSEARVQRVFKASYGISLHEHGVRSRMAEAHRLLLETELPVTQVALACGYEYHSSFSTAYRRAHGKTPVQARRDAASRQFDQSEARTVATA